MTLDQGFADRIEERKRNRAVDGDRSGGSAEAGPRPCLLVVDDEPEITRSIAETLTDDYEVITAGSADEAVALLASRSVAVILTDQRMPGGTGAELLSRSLDIAPETTRILFTGYSDISAVIEAVNEGQVYHYIAKPWRPDELRTVVRQGLERYGLAVENRRLLTELTAANQQLAESNESLREAYGELEAFSYSVSHDLRAPLRHISGFSNLLLERVDYGMDEKSRHYVETIAESVSDMGVLIDDLLMFSHSGRVELKMADVDMEQVLFEALEPVRQDTADRDIEWSIGPLPHVVGDRSLLRQVWSNLLDNASKFSRGRSPARIEVGLLENEPDRTDSAEDVFYVRDNGAGFDMAYADKLFGVFQRLHSAAEYEGTGIGLANVQQIVRRHGGRAWGEAQVDHGATFYFAIPRQRKEPAS